MLHSAHGRLAAFGTTTGCGGHRLTGFRLRFGRPGSPGLLRARLALHPVHPDLLRVDWYAIPMDSPRVFEVASQQLANTPGSASLLQNLVEEPTVRSSGD